jgi:hypothetical protein
MAVLLGMNTDIQPIVPYTPSEASPMFPTPMPPFLEDVTPSPSASPTPYRNTTGNESTSWDNQNIVMTENRLAPHRNLLKGHSMQPAILASQPHPLVPSRSEGSIPSAECTTTVSPLIACLEATAQQGDPLTSKRGSTCNPLDKYTNVEMPTIHDASPTVVLDCIDLALIFKWEQCPGEKLLALPFDTIDYNVETYATTG